MALNVEKWDIGLNNGTEVREMGIGLNNGTEYREIVHWVKY